MDDDDGVLLLCFSKDDIGDAYEPRSVGDHCVSCRVEVWVAIQTLHEIADIHPGIPPTILCIKCGLETAQGLGIDKIELTENQRALLRTMFL